MQKEYMRVIKGTLLAVLAGLTVQGCKRVGDGEGVAPLPTGAQIDTRQQAAGKTEGGLVPKIIVTEAAPEEPIVTILGPSSTEKASGSEPVSVSITLDGGEQTLSSPPQSERPPLTISFDGPTDSPIQAGDATASGMPTQQEDFPSFEPERLKDVAKNAEKGPADDEIIEQGRTVQIYSAPLKNGMTLVLVKEHITKEWDGKQSTVAFHDSEYDYVAYNTVVFGKRFLPNGTQELRFGKGKPSAIVRNAYLASDPSRVSVLLSSREVDDSIDFLTRNGGLSVYQHREETDPVTNQKTVNIGASVISKTIFMNELEWLLDQSSKEHIYSLDLQSNGKFKKSSESVVEINPTKNLD